MSNKPLEPNLPVEMPDEYTELTREVGLALIPHLVYVAQRRETITYGELGELVDRHHRTLSHPLVYVRDAICRARGLPLLSAIVVGQDSGLPGDKFLPGGTDHLSAAEYKAEFERFRDQVFGYEGWEALLEDLGLKPVERLPQDLGREGHAYNEVLARQGGELDSGAHHEFKMYVAQNPARFGMFARNNGKINYLFVSGDRCDVVFDLGAMGSAVVAVKRGQRGELVHGIYELIKHRALLAAEKGHGERHHVEARLIAYQIADDIDAFAKGFDIQCYTISEDTVQRWHERQEENDD